MRAEKAAAADRRARPDPMPDTPELLHRSLTLSAANPGWDLTTRGGSGMETKKRAHCVLICPGHEDAEKALLELRRAGYDMNNVSMVGPHHHDEQQAVGFSTAGDRVRYIGTLGAFWGMVFGLLCAPAFFSIPGTGPMLTGGLIGAIVLQALEGAAAGAAVGAGTGALVAALVSLGIPKDESLRYEEELRANKYLLIASGSADDANRARSILGRLGAEATVHAD